MRLGRVLHWIWINGLNGLLAQTSAACSAHFNISDATSIHVLLRHILSNLVILHAHALTQLLFADRRVSKIHETFTRPIDRTSHRKWRETMEQLI